MMKQIPSQIFKANARGSVEDTTYRCLSTFNFNEYQMDSRKPFGSLKIFNDETLAQNETKAFYLDENTDILLLPLVGTINYKDSLGSSIFINPEEVYILNAKKTRTFEVSNPYEEELINYLQIGFNTTEKSDNTGLKESFNFSIRNQLISLFENHENIGFIGVFDGRVEGTYRLKNPTNGIFAFVINGAFEFQNRLVEARDGLSLWDTDTVEFEALSENAILLLFEISFDK
jgi:redox-sensitive bicupin YhaK (pirin superfamily)